MARIQTELARFEAERRIAEAAVAPWSAELRRIRLLRHVAPADSAIKLRSIAREMSAVARRLRREAERLETVASADDFV